MSTMVNDNCTTTLKAFVITKYGLQSFVADVLSKYQVELVERLGEKCNECSIQNILECPTNGICHRQDKQCTFHTRGGSGVQPCPKNFCDNIMKDLVNAHRYQSPSFGNTNAKLWCTNSWEIAKCFLPFNSEYAKTITIDGIDMSGLISIVLNHMVFQKYIALNLSSEDNVFKKVRALRNEVVHSGRMEVSREDMIKHIDTCKTLLSDKNFNAHYPDAQTAISNLEQLKGGTLDKYEKETRAYLQIALRKRSDLKEKLRLSLIKRYLQDYGTVPELPMLKEGTIGVDEIFRLQNINVLQIPEEKKEKTTAKNIESVTELFCDRSKEYKRVYLIAEAGMGKTMICHKLINEWCNAHTSTDDSITPEQQFLRRYNFLFYIPLWDVNGIVDVIEMVKTVCIPKKFHKIFADITENDCNKCLILLDGLDEWFGENKQIAESMNEYEKGIPYVDPSYDFTLLTTSQPCKFALLNLAPKYIDRKLKISGISETFTEFIVEKLVNFQNMVERNETDKDHLNCVSEVLKTSFELSPIMVTLMTYLWYEKGHFGNSQVQIYNQIKDSLLWKRIHSNPSKHSNYPLEEYEKCQRYVHVLTIVTRLAYRMLLHKDKSNALSIRMSAARSLMSVEEKDTCIESGLVSVQSQKSFISKPEDSLTFFNKEFQEYCCALHVYLAKDQNILQELLSCCNSIKLVLEFKRVFRFIGCMQPHFIGEITKHIADLTKADDIFVNYRSSLSEHNAIVQEIQNLVLNCLACIDGNVPLQRETPLQDLTIEVVNKNVSNGHVLSNIDFHLLKSLWLATSYHSGHVDSLLIKCRNLSKLNICLFNQNPHEQVLNSLVENSARTLEVLCVGGKPGFYSTIHKDSMWIQSLDKLGKLIGISFKSVALFHKDFCKLLGFISKQNHLEMIEFENIVCKSCQDRDEVCFVDVDLQCLVNLKHLSLKVKDLYVERVVVSPATFQTLETCHIWSLHYSTNGRKLGILSCSTLGDSESHSMTSVELGCITFENETNHDDYKMQYFSRVRFSPVQWSAQCWKFISTIVSNSSKLKRAHFDITILNHDMVTKVPDNEITEMLYQCLTGCFPEFGTIRMENRKIKEGTIYFEIVPSG